MPEDGELEEPIHHPLLQQLDAIQQSYHQQNREYLQLLTAAMQALNCLKAGDAECAHAHLAKVILRIGRRHGVPVPEAEQ